MGNVDKKGVVLNIIRTEFETRQTLGFGFVHNEAHDILFKFRTLELPWRDNKTGISCIPEGVYKVVKRWSAKFGHHFHVTEVEGRSWILIHVGNYHTQIRGCILPGDNLLDINKDGFRDVVNSGKTLTQLLDLMPNEFPLIITKEK